MNCKVVTAFQPIISGEVQQQEAPWPESLHETVEAGDPLFEGRGVEHIAAQNEIEGVDVHLGTAEVGGIDVGQLDFGACVADRQLGDVKARQISGFQDVLEELQIAAAAAACIEYVGLRGNLKPSLTEQSLKEVASTGVPPVGFLEFSDAVVFGRIHRREREGSVEQTAAITWSTSWSSSSGKMGSESICLAAVSVCVNDSRPEWNSR